MKNDISYWKFISSCLLIVVLVFIGFLCVFVEKAEATNVVIQGDSTYISYSNIFQDTMSTADSVLISYVQGTDTTFDSLNLTSTGFYENKFKIDSAGFITIILSVYDWQGNGTNKNLNFSTAYFAKNINDYKGASTADSGINQVTFVFYDTVNNEVVTSLKHNVKNEAQSIDYDTKTSNSSGERIWSLDDGGYVMFITSSIYFANSIPDSFTVSGVTLDTIKVHPSATLAPHLSRVYSYIYNKDAVGREGVRITYSLRDNIRYDGQVVFNYPETTYTNSSGYWYADLIRSDSLRPTNRAYYTIIALDTMTNDQIFKRTVKVPDSSFWNFKYWN